MAAGGRTLEAGYGRSTTGRGFKAEGCAAAADPRATGRVAEPWRVSSGVHPNQDLQLEKGSCLERCPAECF